MVFNFGIYSVAMFQKERHVKSALDKGRSIEQFS